MRFKSGKLKDKCVEQLAITDYPKFKFLYDKVFVEQMNKNPGSSEFWKRYDYIYQALNTFIPEKANCYHCENIANQFSFAFAYDSQYKTMYNMSPYHYCSEKECLDSIMANNYELMPIEFNSIFRFQRFPKYLRQDMHEALLKAAGFEGRKTEKAAIDFIDKLDLHTNYFP